MMHLILTEKIENSWTPDGESKCATYKTEFGSKIIFWRSVEEGSENINELEKHALPILVELEDVELCAPGKRIQSIYGCTYSISEECCIGAHSLFDC